jgi:hypothetical protein
MPRFLTCLRTHLTSEAHGPLRNHVTERACSRPATGYCLASRKADRPPNLKPQTSPIKPCEFLLLPILYPIATRARSTAICAFPGRVDFQLVHGRPHNRSVRYRQIIWQLATRKWFHSGKANGRGDPPGVIPYIVSGQVTSVFLTSQSLSAHTSGFVDQSPSTILEPLWLP